MIAPMKKITLLVLDSKKEQALFDLRKLGLVHVETKQAQSQNLTELRSLQNKTIQASSILSDFADKNKKGKLVGLTLSEEKRVELINGVLDLSAEKQSLNNRISSIITTITEYAIFGDFDPTDFAYLKEKGVTLALASAMDRQYKEIFLKANSDKTETSKLKTIRLAKDRGNVLFLIVAGKEGIPANIDSNITILPIPEKSIFAYKSDLKDIKKRISIIDAELKKLSAHILELNAFLKILDKRIEFETIYMSMDSVELKRATATESAVGLAWLIGYVPAREMPSIKKAVSENNWALISEDPTEEDEVPTKLEGNVITETIHPLFDFLSMFPGYFEIDVSWTVLVFFGIFTAMIFGDAGYGLLITLVCLLFTLKAKLSGKKSGTALRLLTYLGLLMVGWGTINASWFGIDREYLPSFLQKIAILSTLENGKLVVKDNTILFISFSLGYIHLILAHYIAIFENKKTLKLLSDIGNILMLTGMYFVVLNILNIEFFGKFIVPIHTWMLISIGLGFVLNFVFGNYEDSITKSIIESLKDIVNQFLGVVNIFADLMSYIRLWAVGLAGASISMTVNSLAGPMFAFIAMIVFGILICLVGHSINMALNVISVLVHGVRLNTMEFSGHVGLDWSGFKYKPFMETVE